MKIPEDSNVVKFLVEPTYYGYLIGPSYERKDNEDLVKGIVEKAKKTFGEFPVRLFNDEQLEFEPNRFKLPDLVYTVKLETMDRITDKTVRTLILVIFSGDPMYTGSIKNIVEPHLEKIDWATDSEAWDW